jgi:uncharacterized membrane protein YgdD (TMEM256/DUF423 family)
MTRERVWVIGTLGMAMAVILGAFGAHALKSHLSEEALRWWQVGVEYHRIHAIGLIIIASAWPWMTRPNLLKYSVYCFTLGALFFSGSLYAMALTDQRWLGAITPLGGSLWIVGWCLLARSISRRSDAPPTPPEP